MKVLFVTRSNIGLSKGGLRRKIDLISEGLHNRGVEVIWYDPWQYQIDSVDVCHFFSTGIEMYPYMETARKKGKPKRNGQCHSVIVGNQHTNTSVGFSPIQ